MVLSCLLLRISGFIFSDRPRLRWMADSPQECLAGRIWRCQSIGGGGKRKEWTVKVERRQTQRHMGLFAGVWQARLPVEKWLVC